MNSQYISVNIANIQFVQIKKNISRIEMFVLDQIKCISQATSE